METYFNGLITLADTAMGYVINAVWLGIIITALGWLVLRYSTRLNAATRYVVWWSVFLLVAALPFAGGIMPKISWSRWGAHSAAASRPTAVSSDAILANVAAGHFVPGSPGTVGSEVVGGKLPGQDSRVEAGGYPTVVNPGEVAARQGRAVIIGNGSESESSLGSVIVRMLPAYVFLLLAAGGWLMLLRLGVSYFLLRRIRSSCVPCDAGQLALFAEVVRQFGLERSAQISCSRVVRMPMAAGFLKPMVILPEGLARELGESELRAVMLHELAHLQRRDDWSKLGQKVLEAVFFFNPVLLWVGRRLDFEREVSCDGWVVARTGQLKGYARCLTRLVQLSSMKPRYALAPGAMPTKKQIFRRFERLLSGQESRDCRFSRTRFLAAAACLVAAVGLGVVLLPTIAVPKSGLTYAELSDAITNHVLGNSPEEKAVTASKGEIASAGPKSSPNTMTHSKGDSRDSSRVGPAVPGPVAATSKYVVAARARKPLHETRAETAIAAVVDSVSALVEDSRPVVSVNVPRGADVVVDDHDGAAYAWSYGTGDIDVTGGSVTISDSPHADDKADDGHGSTTIINDDDGSTYIWSDDNSELRISIEGKVTFGDDERSIKSISEGGSVDIRETREGTKRRLEVEGEPNGELTYIYRVNGKKQAFDDAGKEWYAEILLKFVRNSGFAAENRVKRILAKDGVDGVLDEIDRLEGDWIKRRYYEEMIKSAQLNREQYARVIRMATKDLDSDYEKAELLISVADNSRSDQGLLPEYVEAVGTLGSDYERRRVLSAFRMGGKVDKAVTLALFNIAGRMESDYEKAELLIDMGLPSSSDRDIREAYVSALTGLGSDYEKRRVLTSLAADGPADSAFTADLISIAMGMDSDYEKAELLMQLAEESGDNAALHRLYVAAAAGLASDYEMRRALAALTDSRDGDDESVSAILRRAQQMDSDYERAELLIGLADRVAGKMKLLNDYLDAAGRMSSDYELARTLLALEKEGELDDEAARKFLIVATGISGDYEKGQVLSTMIPHCNGKVGLEDALAEAIDGINSDYERDQLYSRLYKEKRDSRKGSH